MSRAIALAVESSSVTISPAGRLYYCVALGLEGLGFRVWLLNRLTIYLAALHSEPTPGNRECPEVSPEVVSESKGEIGEENSLASCPLEFSRDS
jgi:hypothetical protein